MSLVDTVIQIITNIIVQINYPGIFGLMVLEGMLLPIPSEVVMAFSGYLLWAHELPSFLGIPAFWLLLLVGTVGNLVGAVIAYYIGHLGGMEFVKLYGKKVGISERTVDTVNNWFRKYGVAAVFGTRLTPVFRTFISIPAGLGKMNLAKFCSFTIVGMAIWDTVLIDIGITLGPDWNSILSLSDTVTYIAAGAGLAILVLLYIWHRRGMTSRQRNSTPDQVSNK